MTRKAQDRYYTPERLARVLVGLLPDVAGASVLEPHAGDGAFVKAALAAGAAEVIASDLDAKKGIQRPGDFLDAGHRDELRGLCTSWRGFDLVLGNPPYKTCEAQLRAALTMAPRVAFLMRLAFLESKRRVPFWMGPGRHLRDVWVLAERPSFTGGGTDTAAYGFFFFDLSWGGAARIHPGLTWRASKAA